MFSPEPLPFPFEEEWLLPLPSFPLETTERDCDCEVWSPSGSVTDTEMVNPPVWLGLHCQLETLPTTHEDG